VYGGRKNRHEVAEAAKKDPLKTPTGGTLTKTRELIVLFDFGLVQANGNVGIRNFWVKV
jgi:hypothetical protein